MIDPDDLAQAVVALGRWAQQRTHEPESPLRRRLVEHLGQEPSGMPVVRASFQSWYIRELCRRAALIAAEEQEGDLRVSREHLQVALDELESVGDVTATLLGVGASDEAENDLELGDGWDEDDEELDELR